MKNALKALIAWMDRKWPDKVEVKMADYLQLQAKVDYLTTELKEQRLNKIEAEINKFNVSLGFSGDLSRKMTPFQR